MQNCTFLKLILASLTMFCLNFKILPLACNVQRNLPKLNPEKTNTCLNRMQIKPDPV